MWGRIDIAVKPLNRTNNINDCMDFVNGKIYLFLINLHTNKKKTL